MSTPMFVILDETLTYSRSGDDDDLDHIWCDCTGTERALCGALLDPEDALDEDWEPDEDTCVVCLDLEGQPCGCDA